MYFMLKQIIFLGAVFSSLAANETSSNSTPMAKPPFKDINKYNPFLIFFADYLRQATIFTTTVDFTIPLFSFKFPTKENPDPTALVKQNLVGQFIYFAVVLFSFVASIALPAKLNHGKPQTRYLQVHNEYYKDTT